LSPADVAELVLLLTAAYPEFQLTDQTATVYERFLADLDGELAREAVVAHVATRKWFPRVCEIRDAVLEQQMNAPTVESALAMAQRGIPLDGIAREALKLTGGSWEMKRTTNPSAWRAQFRKTYEGLREGALNERRREATHGLLAQFDNNKQLEDDHDRPAQLTGYNRTQGYLGADTDADPCAV
jgi:hypothetical protein